MHGSIARVAGALCFNLIKIHAFLDGNKRTGALAGITFMNMNGIDLEYALDPENELAIVIDSCAAGKLTREELMTWFDSHQGALV